MTFVSVRYILFVGILFCLYYTVPVKLRAYLLLAASLGFYYLLDPLCLPVLILETLAGYLAGRILSSDHIKHKKGVLAVSVIILTAPLLYYKYAGFLSRAFGRFFPGGLASVTEKTSSLLLPVGISFYTFMSVSYAVDVYRQKVPAEKNPLLYALSISFFPHITSGPIDRPGELLPQIRANSGIPVSFSGNAASELPRLSGRIRFDAALAVQGLRSILLGLFLKVCVADMIGPVVGKAFENIHGHPGSVVLLVLILYTLQLYADFNGYTHIAAGSAMLFGYRLRVNFTQPVFADSIRDFWRRWHLSLSGWFRDYVYIPLGGSRRGKAAKYRNIMITMLISGLWHGAGFKYIMWGGLHGLAQVFEAILNDSRKTSIHGGRTVPAESSSSSAAGQGKTESDKAVPALHRYASALGHILRIALAFLFVCISFGLLRVDSLRDYILLIPRILLHFHPEQFRPDLLGLVSLQEHMIIVAGLCIMFAVDFIHERKQSVREYLEDMPQILRFCIYGLILVYVILVFTYHYGEDASAFIYTRF